MRASCVDMMRRLLPVATIALLLAGCASEAQRRLGEMVETQSASCPIEIAAGMDISEISLRGDTVVYEVSVDGSMPLDYLNANAAEAHRRLADAIAGSETPEVWAELRTCREAGAVMKYVLADSAGGIFTVVVDPKDYINLE